MDEAFVDVRGCDYSNKDLTSKVFSGVLMRGANFANSKFVGAQASHHSTCTCWRDVMYLLLCTDCAAVAVCVYGEASSLPWSALTSGACMCSCMLEGCCGYAGVEFARADAKSADFSNADFTGALPDLRLRSVCIQALEWKFAV
jgi:uncharacterized protein YjbI with pentapeptide repeats